MSKVLALIENNIATTLLLSSHLSGLGYELTRVSGLADFSERLATQKFDWIILDESAVRPCWRRLVEVLPHHESAARLIWFGKPPRTPSIRLHAIFVKPLRYAEIARFFSEQLPPEAPLAESRIATGGGSSVRAASRKGRK